MNQPGTSSGQIAVTSGTQVVTGAGVLTYASILGGATGNAFTIYDGTSTSGTVIAQLGNVTASVTQDSNIPQGVVFNTGLYVVVSGSGTKGVLHYRLN